MKPTLRRFFCRIRKFYGLEKYGNDIELYVWHNSWVLPLLRDFCRVATRENAAQKGILNGNDQQHVSYSDASSIGQTKT